MGRRSLKTTARAGAARAVAGEVAAKAKQTARSSVSAAVGFAASTGEAGARMARSSVSAAAELGASIGGTGARLAKRVGGGLAATMRTAATNDDALWADERSEGDPKATPAGSQAPHDAVAVLRAEAERADQAKATAARAAFGAGASVTEITRAAGESRRTVKEWLADT